MLAATVLIAGLSGCGGGGSTGSFDVTVSLAGQPLSGVQVAPGSSQTVYMTAGQSIELDASEPVVWTLQVGGTAVAGNGVTVNFDGVAVTQTALSDSRILVDTAAVYAYSAPVPITFTATSTIDSALVATITVFISY